MPMKSSQGSEPGTLACYCEKHLPVCNVVSFAWKQLILHL
jgi:hypothetical protein